MLCVVVRHAAVTASEVYASDTGIPAAPCKEGEEVRRKKGGSGYYVKSEVSGEMGSLSLVLIMVCHAPRN